MSDPFARSNEQARRDAVRQQDKAHQDALTDAAKARVAVTARKAAERPNSDIGHPMPRRFFDP